MKAIVIYEHGAVDKLILENLPDPEVKEGDVLVEIKACALNHLDIWTRKGLPNLKLKYPHILGCDISGAVKKCGSKVQSVKEGQRVIVAPGFSCGTCDYCLRGEDNMCRYYGIYGENCNGGYAEFICVPEKNIIPISKKLSWAEAAALPLTFLTAWHMLVTKAQIKESDWVLVLAAGSGVGSAAVQIAKLFGTKVIATASSEDKLELAKKLGADFVVNYREEDFSLKVKEITAKRGVDIVFEHTGEATWEKSILSLAKGGPLVTCGATTGYEAKTDLRHIFFRQLKIVGSTMGRRDELDIIVQYADEGKLKPVVDKVFPLEKAAEAHQYVEDRKQFGKVVLEMCPPPSTATPNSLLS